MNDYYPEFLVLFSSSSYANLLLIDKIINIFKNCKKITLNMYKDNNISSTYLSSLFLILSSIKINFNNNNNKNIALKIIELRCIYLFNCFFSILLIPHNWFFNLFSNKKHYSFCVCC